MCGRFTLRTPASLLVEQFLLPELPEITPRYNIAPTQNVAAIRQPADSADRELVWLRWGLIPSWAKDPAIGNRMINARSETAATKPSFRAAIKRRRCLILADGFYEWQKTGGPKQPYYISMADRRPMALAGLWESWRKGDTPLESCTILTTAANSLMQPLHDRMPVILNQPDYDLWLDPAVQDADQVVPLLRPYGEDGLEAYPVSTLVNRPTNEDPRCLEPLA